MNVLKKVINVYSTKFFIKKQKKYIVLIKIIILLIGNSFKELGYENVKNKKNKK